MKNKLTFLLLPVVALTLSSCGAVIDYKEHLDDYVFTMKYHDNFNVLQLTDIHWNVNTSSKSSEIYMDKLLKEVDRKIKAEQGDNAKIDLIELTGDQFMLSNSYYVEDFVRYFEAKAEEYGFYYASVWGNHDRHGLYNPNWLAKQFTEAKHSLYKELNDNLYGRSNFVINLTDDGTKEGSTKWQLVNLDSGASVAESALSIKRNYDYIRKEQTDWWVREHNRVGGSETTVPTIAYYHIETQDNDEAYIEARKEGSTIKNKFFKLEGFADNGTENGKSDFIDVGSQNNLKAAFMGHDHNNDWTVEYKGVVIGLGVKTGPELYYAHVKKDSTNPEVQLGYKSIDYAINEDFDLIGASLVTIKDATGSFDLEHLYYNETTSGDFRKWVKW